ncbi:potassium voltage-gated channel subfamily KQT member 1-like [Cyanistes caeruleus]|uniref:potassium voltage-gated channel subfamily KQT member 1-like n=1 Tax=Cyanistes caeruleus TaxID=156563 RepID=UPI000CDA648F|nr:potassium voltage-gated channel subfamily KQT member 1-like [Cyanistes caeruleus]
MSYGGGETAAYPVCDHHGEDQGSTLQLSTLSENSKSAALLEVRENLSTMQYSPLALNPDPPVDKGSRIPQSSGEGTKPAACSDSGAGRARTTKCFQSQYLTKTSTQGQVCNFLERPSGSKCFIYHFAVYQKMSSIEGKKLKSSLFIEVGCSSCCLRLDVHLDEMVGMAEVANEGTLILKKIVIRVL